MCTAKNVFFCSRMMGLIACAQEMAQLTGYGAWGIDIGLDPISIYNPSALKMRTRCGWWTCLRAFLDNKSPSALLKFFEKKPLFTTWMAWRMLFLKNHWSLKKLQKYREKVSKTERKFRARKRAVQCASDSCLEWCDGKREDYSEEARFKESTSKNTRQ